MTGSPGFLRIQATGLSGRSIVLIFGFFLSLLIAASVALAQAVLPGQTQDRVFVAAGVQIDELNESAVDARDTGVSSAKAEALAVVLRRMTLKGDWERLPVLEDAALENLIRDFSLADEKFGGGRYLATLTARFWPDGVRQLLVNSGIPFAETMSRPMVVLPVLQSDTEMLLWEVENIWLQAWTEKVAPSGLLPIVVPLGDLSDIGLIDTASALNGDLEAFQRIIAKYGAGGVIVTSVKTTPEPGGTDLRVDVNSRGYGPGWEAQGAQDSFRAPADADLLAILNEVSVAAMDGLEERWKLRNLIQPGIGQQNLQVSVDLSSLDDWLNIEQRLNRTASVRDVSLSELSISGALVNLRYAGDLDRLRLALGQNGLVLEQGDAAFAEAEDFNAATSQFGSWRIRALQ